MPDEESDKWLQCPLRVLANALNKGISTGCKRHACAWWVSRARRCAIAHPTLFLDTNKPKQYHPAEGPREETLADRNINAIKEVLDE